MANEAELKPDVSGLKTEVEVRYAIAGQLELGEHKKEQQEDQVEKPETPSKAGSVQSAASQALSPSGPEECEQIPGAAAVTDNNGSLHEAAKSETPSAVTIILASHSKTEGETLHKPPSDVQVPLQEALKSSDDDLQHTEEVEGLKNEKGEPRGLPLEPEHVDHGSAEASDKSTKMEHEKECNAELSQKSDHTQVQGWHGTEEESNENFNSKVSGIEDRVHKPSEATKSDKEVVVEVEETKDVLYAEENRIQNSGTYSKDHNGEDLSDDKSSPQTATENEEAESKPVKKDQSIVNANEISSRSCEESKIDQNDENRSEHQLESKDEMGTEQQESGNSLALEATEVLQPSEITEELETLSSQNPEISIKATMPTGKHEENMEGSDCEGTLCSAAVFPEAVGAIGNNEYVRKEIDKTVQDTTTLPLEERASRENVLEEDQKASTVSESPKEHNIQIQTEDDLNVDVDDKVEKQNMLDMSRKMIPEDKKTVDISSSAEIVEENPQKSADVLTISDKQVDSGLGYQGSRSADESIIPAHPTVPHRQDNDTPMPGDKSEEEVQRKELVDDQHLRTEHQEDANTEENFEGTSLESCRSIGNHAESTIPEEGLETENFPGKQDNGLKEDETASGKAMEISYQTIRSSGVTIETPREITPGEEAEVSGVQSTSNSGKLYVEGNGAELGFKLETDQQTKLTENVDVKIDKTEENTELPLKKESVEEINVIHEIHSGSQKSQMVAQQNHHNLDAIEVAGVITSSDASAKEIKVSDSSTFNEKIEDTLNAEESLKNANEERNDDKVQNGDTEELDRSLEDAVVESDQDSQLPDRIVTRTEGMNNKTSNSDHVSDMNGEDSEMTRESALLVNRASVSSLNDSKEMKLEVDTIPEQKNQNDTEGQVKGDDADKKTGVDTEVLNDKKLESKSEMIHESISGHEEVKRNLSHNEEKDTAQIEHESSNEKLGDLPVVQALFVQTLDLVEQKNEIPFIPVHEDQIQEDTGTERHVVDEDPQEEILEDNQRIKADTIACDIVSGKNLVVVEPAKGNEHNEVADTPPIIEFENKEKEEPEEVRPKAKDEMKENSGMPNHESSLAQAEGHAAEERKPQNNFEMGKTLVVVEPAKGNEHNEAADALSIIEFENKEKEKPEEATPKAKDEMKENSDMLNHGSSLAQAEEHTAEERKPQNNIEMEKYLTIDKQETDGDVTNTTELTPQNEYGAEQLTCRDNIVKIVPENDSNVNNCEEAAASRREQKMNSDRSKAEASQIEKEEGGMSESSEKINSTIPGKMELADTKIPDNADTEIKSEELTLPDEVANSNLQDEEQKGPGNGRDLPNTIVLEFQGLSEADESLRAPSAESEKVDLTEEKRSGSTEPAEDKDSDDSVNNINQQKELQDGTAQEQLVVSCDEMLDEINPSEEREDAESKDHSELEKRGIILPLHGQSASEAVSRESKIYDNEVKTTYIDDQGIKEKAVEEDVENKHEQGQTSATNHVMQNEEDFEDEDEQKDNIRVSCTTKDILEEKLVEEAGYQPPESVDQESIVLIPTDKNPGVDNSFAKVETRDMCRDIEGLSEENAISNEASLNNAKEIKETTELLDASYSIKDVVEGENQNIFQKEPDVEILDSTKMMPEAIKETKGEEANNMLENSTVKKVEKQDEEVRCDLKGAEGRDTTNPIYITETEVSIKEVSNDHGSTKQNFDQLTTSIIAGSVELKDEKTDKILDVSAATSEATEKNEPEQVDIKCEQDSALIMQEPNLKNEANMAIYSENAEELVPEPLALHSNNASEEMKNGSSLIGTDPDNSLKTSPTIGALKGPIQKEDGEKVTVVAGINETVYLNKDGKENGEAVISATQTMIEETSQVMQEKAVNQENEAGQCDTSRELQQQMSDDDLPASQFLMNRILQDDFLGEVDGLKPEDRIHDEKHNIEHINVDVPKEDNFKIENQVGVENIIEKDKRDDISQSETKLNTLGDEKGRGGYGLLRSDIEDDRREPKERSDPLNEHIVDADDTDGEEFSFTEKAFVQNYIKDKVNLTAVQKSNSEKKVDAEEKNPEDLLPDKNLDEENRKENQQDDIHLNQSLDDASTTNFKNEVRLKDTGKSSNESKEIQPGTQMVEKATADEEESLINCEQSLPALQNQADSTLACQTESMVDVNEIKVSHPVSTEQLYELEERSLAATENLHHDETPKNNMGVSLATTPSEKEIVPRVEVENPVDTNQLQSNIELAEKVKADDKPSPTIESFDSEEIESLSHGENGQDREFQEAEGLGYVVVKDQKHDILENGTENKVEDTQWKTPTNAEPGSAEVKQALADDSRDSDADVVSVKKMIQIAETKLEDTPTAKENLAFIAKGNKSGVRDDQGGHESVKERSQVAEISLENKLEAKEDDTSKSNEKKDDVVKNENHGVESVKEMTQVAETNFENKAEVQEKLPFIEKENQKGGNNDNNAENATGEPSPEASSLIEIREAEPISQHKKHTILSGVRSKVKHSITSVKKAITCSSTMTPE